MIMCTKQCEYITVHRQHITNTGRLFRRHKRFFDIRCKITINDRKKCTIIYIMYIYIQYEDYRTTTASSKCKY